MSNVLITGGAGFVGIPTVKAFAADGHLVSVLDSFAIAPRDRIAQLSKIGARVYEVDIRNRNAVTDTIQAAKPDIVVHLAALHFIPFCIANPSEALSVNVLGTQHVLDAVARTDSVKVFTFASTADVYQPDSTAHHEASAVGSDNVYGLSKMIGEELVAVAQRQGAFERSVITRFFNVVGPGETNAHLVPDILDYMTRGNRLPLGSTDTRRDYVYVDDVARVVRDLTTTDLGPTTTTNVGSGISYSADEIVTILSAITNRPLVVNTDQAKVRKSDRPNLQADISHLQQLLPHFTPTPLVAALRAALVERHITFNSLAA